MVDLLTLFARHSEFAWIATLASGQNNVHGAVLVFTSRDVKNTLALLAAQHGFRGLQIQIVFPHYLVPAMSKLFFRGAIQPQLSLGRLAVRFGINPLALWEILNRICELLFLKEHIPQSALRRLQRCVQTSGPGTDDDNV